MRTALNSGADCAEYATAKDPTGPIAYGIAFVVVVALAIATAVGLSKPDFAYDDAYITLHNAQTLLRGYDPNYGDVPALAGATSPVHLILVAVCGAAFGLEWGMFVVGWLAILLYALGLIRMSMSLGAGGWVALALTGMGTLPGFVPHQLSNGLETGLAMATITWGVALALDDRPWARRCFGPLLGVMPWVRPELGLVAIGLLFVFGLRLASSGTWKREVASTLAWAMLFAVPWALWCTLSLGSPIPMTAEVKRLFFAESLLPVGARADLVRSGIRFFLGSIWPVGLGLLALPFVRVGWVGISLILAMVGGHLLLFPSAVQAWEFRYLTVLTPFAIAGWAVAASSAKRLTIPLGVLCVAVTMFAARNVGLYWDLHGELLKRSRDGTHQTAQWCRANLPEGSRLLVHDAGTIAFETEFPLTDVVGLRSPWCVSIHRRLTARMGDEGRVEAIAEIARRSRPDYLVATRSWIATYQLAKGLEAAGYRLEYVATPSDYDIHRLVPR